MRTTPADLPSKTHDETKLAEEIVDILPTGVARELSADRDAIRFAVRADGMRLRTIILRRTSLRRLIDDPARDVKVEYLQRDLLRSATHRTEFQYPRPLSRPVTTPNGSIARLLVAGC